MTSVGFENYSGSTMHQQPQSYPKQGHTTQPYPQQGYPPTTQGGPSTVVVVEQGGERLRGQRQNVNIWASGLCSCFDDIGTCIFNMFCPCVHACTIAGKLNESCLVPTLFGQAGHMAMRTKLRTAYGIQGSIIGDCCLTAWCGNCVLCQMEKELNIRGTQIF